MNIISSIILILSNYTKNIFFLITYTFWLLLILIENQYFVELNQARNNYTVILFLVNLGS